jgi:hypothetical protein
MIRGLKGARHRIRSASFPTGVKNVLASFDLSTWYQLQSALWFSGMPDTWVTPHEAAAWD